MPRATREATVVVLLDWQGRVVWISEKDPVRGPGEAAEIYVREDYRTPVQKVVHQVVYHRTAQQLQLVNENGEHYRVWVWPLDSPDVAVCALAIAIPEELALLSAREQDCLKLLGHGLTARMIAAKLKIAVSTVHTHLKRSREKLGLPSLEALTSFAARFGDTFAVFPSGEMNLMGH